MRWQTMGALALVLAGCENGTAVHAPMPDASGPEVGMLTPPPQDAAATETLPVPKPPEQTQPPPSTVTPGPDTPPPLVVHEWGTFTSVQGSDGSTLDGLQHEEEHLPDFVYGRSQLHMNKTKAIEGLPEPCNQKMETPVVYFHTPIARDVVLKVDFPQGIISQWFPAATTFWPPLGALGANDGTPPTSGLSKGSLTWKVRVDPALDMAAAPPVPKDSVWLPSRQTNAAPLRYQGLDHKDQKVDQTERLLFYRGLGRFTLPVQVLAAGKGALTLRNTSKDTLPYAVLLHATAGGKGGVQVVGALAAGQDRAAQIPAADLPLPEAMLAAQAALKAGIVASGLHDDEAQAMVDTWRKSWFATPGVRLLYVLPQGWTEQLLPLQVQPQPTQTVRTLVGRIEILTPEDEAVVVDSLLASLAAKSYSPLQKFDRFLEPRLRRACKVAPPSPGLQAHCDQVLAWAAEQP